MNGDYRPGDVVSVTIERAEVVNVGYDDRYDSPYLRIAIPIGDDDEMHGRIHLDAPGVTVERIAPENWPPQSGDLWRDHRGGLWFAVERLASEGGEVVLTCNGRNRRPFSDIHALYGPMTLVYREDAEAARTAGSAS